MSIEFYKELAAALDAMPVKRLIAGELFDGADCCSMGAVALARGITVQRWPHILVQLDIPEQLWDEVVNTNDCGSSGDCGSVFNETPEARWIRMRAWVDQQINEAAQ